MPLTRLDNLISSKTGKYLYVSPDDFNATDALSNRGNSPVTPFKSIQRAFLEIARYSYIPGFQNDRFDQFSIMLMPGIHYIDNRPGLVDTSGIDVFGFDQATNAWTDDSILDLSNPDNIFYKFNNTEGGAIIPRGSSLVGYDLRRTVVRPLFVPDPAVTEREIPRSAMFNVTGGCYFWQFTLKDGQTTSESPLYNAAKGTGEVYYDPTDFSKKAAPNYSHHKLTVFEYADNEELGIFYRKIAKAFSAFQPTIDDPGEFDTRVQENRIVGPLSDSRVIESLTLTDATTDPSIPASTTEVTVTTKVDHGYFQGQFVAIANTEIDDVLEGIFQIKEIDQNDARQFKYDVPFVTSGIGNNIVSGQTVSVDTTPALGQNAQTLAEVDSVESASPYVFNCSIRSTWGICGIWANGLKATGFKSVVIAQYTGVSLQKDDRSFIRYDEYTNTWNQASLVDAFATVPYHTKGDSYWKDDWRNFHVRASEDAFIQCVSIFAVGFADHFLMESGGDMSITNSNSNFGNTSLHAIGYKGFAFNQDKGGFITDIIPPQTVVDNTANTKKISYYTIDVQGTLQGANNYTKLFLGNDEIVDPLVRPAATINGYRLGAKSDDKLYVKLDPAPGTDEFFDVQLEPTGFVKYVAKGSILNPTGGVVNSVYADAANLIESNRRMIQEEVFGYILEKYPALQNIPYVNPGLNPAGNRYFDARNLIIANRQEIVDTAFDDMITTYGSTVIDGIGDGKCKRDIGLVVDAVAEDLKDGGNANVIAATREYFDGDGNPLTNGLVGEEDYATYAFRRAKDLCKRAIANLLTVKADLYDPDPNSNLTIHGINAGKTGSQAETDGDTTNGVTIDLALKADPASRYKDARNQIVANREFILDAAVAEVSVYHPDFYHNVDGQTNSQSRLADAFRLIRRNSTEIKHKALASIAVSHPNFYIDGDNQVDAGSRYASAYRLISNNRDQIIDTALAETTVQHPDYYFVGDQETDARSRYADGYRLIKQNRTEIVNTAWANMLVSYPAHGQYEEKCKRDLGIFVDAVGLDLFVGGNKYSRKFISEYFSSATTWISGGLQGEESQSIEAFNQARDQMKLAVANQLSIQDLSVTPGPAQYNGGGGDVANNNAGACDDVQSAIVTLTDIVTTQVAAGNLNALPAETSYIAGPGEEKCRRDIGIFVDSIALDLFCKGNVYTHRFGAEFFENSTTPEFSFNSGVYNTNFNKAADMIKQAITNQLYEKDLFRTADNAPGSAYGQVSKDFTPHGASYTAATGELVLDIANHGLSTGDRVKIADDALTFTCDMDGNYSNHTYPRNSDPASGQYIEITSSSTDSITVNVGATTAVNFTPTAGTYDAATGLLVLTIGAHSLTTGTTIKIADNSLKFKCSMDDYGTVHSYPRVTDPVSGEAIAITAVTSDSITVNVGQSPLVQFTPTNASFTPTTGIMELTIGDHSLRGADRYTPSNAAYNPTTGIITLTIADHGFADGNVVRIDDSALTFTCGEDGNGTNHSYPRASDPVSGMWIPISNVTQNTFDVQVLADAPSTNVTPHVFVSAAANSVTFPRDSIKLADGAVTFRCDQDGQATDHAYPRTTVETATVTGADYNPTTGVMEITIANHGLKNNEQIKFADDSLTFTCLEDNNGTNHTYPRSSDPVSDKWLKIFNVQTNTFQVQVLDSAPSTNTTTHTFVSATTNGLSFKKDPFYDNSIYIEEVPSTTATVTNATYNAATGVIVVTSAGHGLSNGNKVKFELGSLTFSCTKDGNATNHSYPRISDPSYDEWLTVANKTNDTFEVNVGISGTNDQYVHTFVSATNNGLLKQSGTIKLFVGVSSNTTTHAFQSALANSVKTGGTYTHVWAGASANAVVSGGNYSHTFISAAADSVNFAGNTANQLFDAQSALCSDVQSAVDSLTSIVTTILSNGNLSTMPIEVNYGSGKGPGELKCARDLGYFIDAITVDMYCEGNKHTRAFTEQYFTNATTPLSNGLVGEEAESVTAYSTAINEMKRAVTNQLYHKDLTVTEGLAIFSGGTPVGTPTAAAYNATTGAITLTIAGNSLQNGDKVKIVPDSLTFTCDMGTGSAHTWVGGTASGAVTVNSSDAKDVTNASYTPTTGVLELTIGAHSYTAADTITIAANSLAFTCAKDQNQTTHTYPRTTDPVYNKSLPIISATGTTITVNVGSVTGWKTYPRETDPAANVWLTVSNKSGDQFDVNVGPSPIVAKNVTGASYSGTDGTLELTIGAHSYTTLQSIFLEPGSLTFTCDMDGHATEHTYPRVSDPAYNTALPIIAITATSITVDVGKTPIVNHDVTDATYTPTTGELELTIGSHSIPAPTTFTPTDVAYNPISGVLTFTHTAGEGAFENDDEIKIADDSLVFSCDAPMGAHAFVQGSPNGLLDNLGGNYTAATGTTYDPATGVLELEIGAHSLTTSNTIEIADDAVTFTCAADNNASNHSYPRATDPASGQALAITAVTATTITVNVGIANANTPNGNEGTYPRATDPVRGKWLTISNATATTFDVNVGEANVGSTHTFVSAAANCITKSNARIKIADDKLSFTCDHNGDNNTTVKTYPRNAIDTASASAGTTYNAATGLLKITTTSNHGFQNGDFVKFDDDSLTFTCAEDSNQTQHAYPRSTDPVSGEWIKIDNVTANTFEVNILQGTTPTNTTAHVFVSGTINGIKAKRDRAYDQAITVIGTSATTITVNVGISSDTTTHNWAGGTSVAAVQSGGSYNHIFVSATPGAVKTGGDYNHTFVGATVNAVTTTSSTVESRTSSGACADVQSAIVSLGTIVTDAITAGNITGGIWNQPANTGTFITGEAKCRRDLGIVVDAVAQDLWFGGNEFTIAATKEYFQGNQLLANGLDVTKEVTPAISAFKRAEELMQRALTNTYYDRDLNITLDQTGDPPIVGNIECDAHDMVLDNKEFIAKEAYLRMKAAYPAYTPSTGNTEQDCLDDVYDVLREVMWDVKFGGNYKTYDVAKGYITNDFNGKTYPQIIQDVERDEVAKVFQEAKSIAMEVVKNETVTVSSGNTLTQKIDSTIVTDWDDDELLPKCGSAVAAVDTLMDIIIGAIGTDAGVGNLDGVTRTTQDNADPAWNKALNIVSTTATSITLNVGASASQDQYPHTFIGATAGAVVSGGAYAHTFVSASANSVNVVNGSPLTPTNATYDAATGALTLYFGSAHGVTTSDQLSLDDNSLTFTCDMGRDTTTKTYPRVGTDPVAGANVNPTAVTSHSITINVGASPLVEHNVSNAVYDPSSGSIALTIGAHSLAVGTSVKLKDESLVFKCTKDQNTLTHAYPRASGKYRPTAYADGNCSDVLATVNALVDIACNSLSEGNLNNLPPLNNGEWDCANVRSSIEVLFDILQDAVVGGTLAGLPPLNTGDFTINNEASKCFRDVTYIVDAIVNDLRLGGNLNSIQAGEAYYVGNNLEYIQGEKTETLDAWNYVGQIATAAMRNFDVLAFNCSTTAGSAIVDVNDTRGIIIGMSVKEYDDTDPVNPAYVNGLLQSGSTQVVSNIPAGTYVKRIVSNTQIELGVNGSRLVEGNSVNALQNSTTTELYFVYEKGIWADTSPTTVTVGPESEGPDIIADTTVSSTNRECSGTANAIETLVGNITTIINSGLGTVVRSEQTVNTALLASRATVFTIDISGAGPSNPHDFETGTPVRLVPRPRFDQVTGKYVDVDKRLVRLPNGFNTNQTYYVIAPGRVTQPENYGGTSFFNGSDQTRLMLATSRENAASGIYIYASETDSIDKDVEIDLYQFVLDDKYDLHAYSGSLSGSVYAGIETTVSNIFDVPNAGTTSQKAFIRAKEGSVLPLISTTYENDSEVAVTNTNDSNVGRINPNIEFFTRYQNNKTFTLHKTHADAINNVNPITFAAGQAGLNFDVYANKRRSPMRFDPSFTDATASNGKWYIQCKDQVTGVSDPTNNIFWRLNETDYADRQRTTDAWYERLEDDRDKDDRTYKIRMVIPKYLENARDPINGFVLKTRTDDTRKLVPQKVLLKPVVGTVYGARFENPVQAGEYIGYDADDFKNNSLNVDAQYDPFKKDQTGSGIEYRAFARFNSGIQATIQSGRYVEDVLDPNIKYLELNLYDHAVDTRNFPGLRNETFTTVKITSPQGGNFVTSKVDNTSGSPNAISFAGNSSGLANVHAYYTVNGNHYIIIKNIRGGDLEYSEYANTRFTQGNVFADMLEDQDMGKSLPLKTQIAKNNPQYFYKQNGANVYTITPGDRIQDNAGVEYYVDSVEDAGIIEDTFYIFGYETLQKRIAGQQDGIYYLTALRGNVSPFPTGAGVTNNFKKFKFSQPVSKLYPLNYRNDPLWFKKSGTSQEEKDYYAGLIDPPQVYSAADNYTHGLVTVNDFKNSTTREMVADLTEQPAFLFNSYTGTNAIQAQSGNATSGSEDRRISISGDSTVLVDQKYYVELRRPSIARAGNHTFEYLGFGPGNYSTGLPARQEVVLTPEEDFYAQSKKQDAGIVFYTGINSQGDLYIGNRRINAITGEETFIDSARLVDDGDEDDTIGGLVTTFDTPVTFNQNITVVGGNGELVNTFESPITIAIQDSDLTQQRDALIIRSNVSSIDPVTQLEQDQGLDRTSFAPPTEGDIRISKNRIQSAIFGFNARGNGQAYMMQTHTIGGIASNATPNQSPLIDQGGTTIDISQTISYGGVSPAPGDMLLKGSEVGKSGSLAWIFSNYFTQIGADSIDNIVFDGTNVVKLSFRDFNTGVALSNTDIGITTASQIRIKNFYYDPRLNLTWQVYSKPGDAFNPANNYCHFQVIDLIPQDSQAWESIVAGKAAGTDDPTIEFSNSNFKELGVIGAEALRTETETIGDYKLGINTVVRAAKDAYKTAFVSNATDPRANLDVVGNAYISGRKTGDFLGHNLYADRDKTAIDDAFLVGGDSATETDEAVFRVATTNNGRVGINVDNSQLDRAFVVDGLSRFTDDAKFEHDIEVNGDDGTTAEIRTSQTTGTFNLVTDSTFEGTINIAGDAQFINIGNDRTLAQTVNLFNSVTGDHFINIGTASAHSNIFIGTVPETLATEISKVEIGGAYTNTNEDLSYTKVKTRNFRVDGDMWLGFRRGIGDNVSLKSQASQVDFLSNTGGPSILNFATNASEINIAGQGGTTTINNQLKVIASAQFDSNITLCGGVASFSFVGERGQLGSAINPHDDGVLSQTLFNKNIDILNVIVVAPTDEGYNQVDTAGNGPWGSSFFQNAKTGLGGSPVVEPQDLPALTGTDEYYLPLANSPVKANGDPYFSTNDYLLIDSPVNSANEHPELVQIVELTRINVSPYFVKVKRQPIGTFTTVLDTHPDNTPIYRVNVQFDATWTEQALDGNGPQDNVYLAEFGGNLTNTDYVVVGRADGTPSGDGIDDFGEVIKVVTPLSAEVQKFKVSKDCSLGDAGDVFTIDSTTGDTYIGGDTILEGQLRLEGGCGTISRGTINGTLTPNANEEITRYITNVSPADIAKVQIGDTVKFTGTVTATMFGDTRIEEIDSTQIKLTKPIVLNATLTNISFTVVKNEEFIIQNGNDQNTLYFDTCAATMEIGNQYRRLDIERVLPAIETIATTTARYSGNESDIRLYSYWLDPQGIQVNGPNSTLSLDAATGSIAGSVYLTVNSIGEGTGRFAEGDLVVVGDLTVIGNGGVYSPSNQNQPKWEIMEVAAVDVAGKLLRCLPAKEGTTANALTDYLATTTTVQRILKHSETSNLVDIETRVRGGVDFCSVIIDNGRIAQTKFDYLNWFRLYDKVNDSNELFFINGGLAGKVHTATMDETILDGTITHRNGDLILNKDMTMYGGIFTMKDSVGQTNILQIINDDGHADHSGTIYFDAGVLGRGDFKLYSGSGPEDVLLIGNQVTFKVDNDGDAEIGNSLKIVGLASEIPSKTPQFQLNNLGTNGADSFIINRDNSIDAFGINNYYTKTGGRHGRYISSGSDAADLNLEANVTYFANVTNQTNLICYLPENPITGDEVRFVEVGGNLSYDTMLIVRALTPNTKVQGDAGGTTIGLGGTTPYNSGELVVQTANAGFTLIYLGSTDSQGTIVSSSVQGWWLKEV